MMRWEQGRDSVERLIEEGRIDLVEPGADHARRLLDQAARHVESAIAIAADDPEGAYSTLYDCARKSLWAVLAVQGLRPTRQGGHLAVYEVAHAQLHPPLGSVIRPFDRMRRQRNSVEYPEPDSAGLVEADVLEDAPKVKAIHELAVRVIDEMPPF